MFTLVYRRRVRTITSEVIVRFPDNMPDTMGGDMVVSLQNFDGVSFNASRRFLNSAESALFSMGKLKNVSKIKI
jgi:hypothetical protein